MNTEAKFYTPEQYIENMRQEAAHKLDFSSPWLDESILTAFHSWCCHLYHRVSEVSYPFMPDKCYSKQVYCWFLEYYQNKQEALSLCKQSDYKYFDRDLAVFAQKRFKMDDITWIFTSHKPIEDTDDVHVIDVDSICLFINQFVITHSHQPTIQAKESKETHFTLNLNSLNLVKLHERLIINDFISQDTKLSHFSFALCGIPIPDGDVPFQRIKWIKPNSRTNGLRANKKALLDLFSLLGMSEVEIRNKKAINELFEIVNGGDFKSNNYTDITDSRGRLCSIESEYHTELQEIVNFDS